MNFLGVGVGELLLILVIAMMVVGPERMVELAGQMGRLLAKFREQSDSVTREFKEAFTLDLEEDAAVVEGATVEALPAGDEDAHGAVEGDVPEVAGPSPEVAEPSPEVAEPSPEEVAALEAVQLEQRLASDMVDGELEVALPEVGAEGDGAAEIEDDSYQEIEPVDLPLATVVPEDQDVEPTPVNDVLMIPDEDASAELPLEAKE
jgi:Sec-independent protein translocase protein TatA